MGSIANAAEIRVLSTHAVMEVLSILGPGFERASGRRLSLHYDPANVIKSQIEGGVAFDVAIVTRPVLDELVRQGKIAPNSCVDIARCGLGVSVRKGAQKPPIGTIEDFNRAMTAAKSIVRSRDGTSGHYFATLLARLGIEDDVRGKIRLGGSGRVAELVASGEVEMAVQQISELLPVIGTEFVGPFPPDLQLYTVFAAGVSSASKQLEAAHELIEAMIAPEAAPHFEAKGLEPGHR